MSTYHISVKAEPDWSIEGHKGDPILQNEERNVGASTYASDGNIQKELHGNPGNVSNVDMEQVAAESSSNDTVEAGLPGEPVRVATPGFHRRYSWSTSRKRTSNFSSKDCQIFRQIVDKYSDIVFNTKTDTATNLNKKKAWVKIVAEFNALTEEKRTFKQLQAKFDNMKRRSKKTKVIITVAAQDTNGAQPRSATPLTPATIEPLSLDGFADNEALNVKTQVIKLRDANGDKSRSAMPLTPAINEPLSLDGLANNEAFNMKTKALITVPLQDTNGAQPRSARLTPAINEPLSLDGFATNEDFDIEVQFAEGLETTVGAPHSTAVVTDTIPVEFSEVPLIPSLPSSLPRSRDCHAVRHATSVPQPRFRKRTRPAEIEHERSLKWRQSKLEALHCTRAYDKILFQTKLQHLEEKRREEKEIYELKKRKLELEIRLMERQNKI